MDPFGQYAGNIPNDHPQPPALASILCSNNRFASNRWVLDGVPGPVAFSNHAFEHLIPCAANSSKNEPAPTVCNEPTTKSVGFESPTSFLATPAHS